MKTTLRNILGAVAVTVLWTGCGTGPPGGGVTNGDPVMLGGSEKAAQPSDQPSPALSGGKESLGDAAAGRTDVEAAAVQPAGNAQEDKPISPKP